MNCSLKLKPLVSCIAIVLAAGGTSAVCAEELVMLDQASVEAQQYQGYAEYSPTSGSKTDLPWLKVPQSVSVVTKAEMEDKGALRLVDALDGVAGVNNTLGEGSRDQFVIRGFDALNDTYRDGMRDDGNLQSFRSLANVERVEVVKGPAGALYGRGSAGGLINIVTKRADGRDITALTTSAGSDSRFSGQVDVGRKLTDNVNGRVNVEYREGDSYVDHVDYQDYFIAPTVRIAVGAQHVVDLDLEYQHQEVMPYRGVPSKDGKPVDVPVDTFYGGTNDYQESDSIRLAIHHQMTINDQLQWVNRASWNQIELEQKGTRQGKVTDDEVSQTVNNFGYDPRTTSTLQSEITWQTEQNQLLAGVDYNVIDIDLLLAKDTSLSPQDINDPVTRATPNPGFDPFRTNKTATFGAYLQDVFTYKKLSVLGGLRYDKMELEQRKEGADLETMDDNKVSYRTGLVYQLTDEFSAYASLGRSWQLPYAGIYINPKLAELFKTDLQEIGVKAFMLDDRLMLNAALFQIDQEQPQTDTNGDVVDKKEFRHKGIELEARGQISEVWNISAGYSYLDAEDKETGFKPNDVSDHLFSLWTTYYLTPEFKFGGGVKYVGDRYAGNNEATKLDAYSKVDLMAAYQWQQHKLQLNLDNVFDEKYALGATGGGSGLNQVGYGAPFEVMLSYRYSM